MDRQKFEEQNDFTLFTPCVVKLDRVHTDILDM